MTPKDDQRNTDTDRKPEPEFNRMIESALSRRGFLAAAASTGAAAFLGGNVAAKPYTKEEPLLGFKAILASTLDTIRVPEGYQAEVLISWGDPLFAGTPGFASQSDAATQAKQFGDNNDGMTFFQLDENRGVLCVNNETTNYEYLFGLWNDTANKRLPKTAEEVQKAQAAHGVSIVELKRVDGRWVADRQGKLNRRITATTPMELKGPAAGHPLMQTAADKTGRTALGTFNNCANGETPWGTYLTCEENIHNYFGSKQPVVLGDTYQRYLIQGGKANSNPWQLFDDRFDLGVNPNEPHRHGWVVEIDPQDPTSTPIKRTALGRMKHENAALIVNNRDGRVVVYMGDDEKGEHIYKYVSHGKYDPEESKPNNGALLDEGTLYVAKFEGNEDDLKGTGKWIELTHGKNGLTPENGFADQATILMFARLAATQVGATTMDRPEWVAVHPDQKTVYCTLTNNVNRGVLPNQPIDAANPRQLNPYGHIIRWAPLNGDHTADTFEWDLYVLAGNPTVYENDLYAGSSNIDHSNLFNSPDGLGFDKDGRLWIQTDGNESNAGEFRGMGNNQMLCGDPHTGEIRRFLTGPVGCEITGLTFSQDSKTMFIGVQHPGQNLTASHFPDGGKSMPRSSVMRITRKDAGVIGT